MIRVEKESSTIGQDTWVFEADIAALARQILRTNLPVSFEEDRGEPNIEEVKVVDGTLIVKFATYQNTEQS